MKTTQTMKATELMIGDWVYYCQANAYATQVGEIRSAYVRKEDYICCLRDERDPLKEKYPADDFNTEILSPIPLTKEILKKNGWEYNDEEAKFFPETWVGGGLMLQERDEGFMIVVTSDYDDEDTNSTPFILLYVHELQHALRLRRIEKEIEV